jgi:hypothetical protein
MQPSIDDNIAALLTKIHNQARSSHISTYYNSEAPINGHGDLLPVRSMLEEAHCRRSFSLYNTSEGYLAVNRHIKPKLLPKQLAIVLCGGATIFSAEQRQAEQVLSRFRNTQWKFGSSTLVKTTKTGLYG